jgi:hypothetical protein
MRFEVISAFAIGILLPLLETVRRGIGYWAIEATTMLEDYLAGSLLLMAAFSASRGAAFAGPLLLTAWASVSSMMTTSLVSQIEDTVRAVDLEPHNGVVLVVKLLLWAICLGALVRSFRGVQRAEDARRGT